MKFLVMEVSQLVGKCKGAIFFQTGSCRMNNSLAGDRSDKFCVEYIT